MKTFGKVIASILCYPLGIIIGALAGACLLPLVLLEDIWN